MGLYAPVVWLLLLTGLPAQPQASGQQTPTSSGSAQAAMDPAKEADIRRLLELTGTRNLMLQMMSSMEQNIRPLLSNSFPPGDYRDKLIDLFFAKLHAKADPARLLDLAVPVYDKYFTREEIKGLIQFYQTPLGQKTVAALPKITGELGEAGRHWGEQMGRECMQEVLAEHPDLAAALEAAGKSQ